MIKINGLEISEWHPFLHNNEWCFPIDHYKSSKYELNEIYNFVLDKYHIITINNIKCCTLGHGFTLNNIISHPYYGTNRIIYDLMKMNGWSDGLIILDESQYIRNEKYVMSIQC
jgi:hypothetical protein